MREDENKESGRVPLEKRVLIIDHEQAIGPVVAEALRKNGYPCVIANSWKEALPHFYGGKYSLIICDMNTPKTKGIELLEQVKSLNPHVMIIFVNPYPEIDVTMEVIRLGTHNFVIKPIDLGLTVFSVKKAFENDKLDRVIESYSQNLGNSVRAKIAALQTASPTVMKSHLNSFIILADAIESKDPYTRGHSDRVGRLSMRIGIELGLTGKGLEDLLLGAWMHDIGKIAIKDEVLLKPGLLSREEYRHVQEHPLIGVEILEAFDSLKNKSFMIRNHHEHFDGRGYPDGLVGEEIPIEARIIAISDAFDAMTSLRPHRANMPLEVALQEMKEGAGKQFDPGILETFLKEKLYYSPTDYSPANRAPSRPLYRQLESC